MQRAPRAGPDGCVILMGALFSTRLAEGAVGTKGWT